MFFFEFWNLFRLFVTPLMFACSNGNYQIVKSLLDFDGIEINERDILLFYLMVISLVFRFKITFGIYLNYLEQHSCMHLKMVLPKLSNYFLNKKELMSTLKMSIFLI